MRSVCDLACNEKIKTVVLKGLRQLQYGIAIIKKKRLVHGRYV